ncbi:C2H2-like zinc finger protein [Prunus dulcis]|uniref:C2H2-like zinc finger protein n=1 Tax=Prunus dulcis TaxID=3755 RepID=A0A4Y1RFY0_PRUDU|nr:C2H2-like zinc finger protein [Prunus dulcis]
MEGSIGWTHEGSLGHSSSSPKTQQLTESASSSSSSSGEEPEPEQEQKLQEEEEEEKGLVYGLRENPKRSFRLADPEFSFAVDAGSVIQDRESETESKNPTRRRSKRNRRSFVVVTENQRQQQQQQSQKLELQKKTHVDKFNTTQFG